MPTDFRSLVIGIIDIINLGVQTLFAVVFIYFAWKLIDAWIINAGDETKRSEGRQIAITGVIVFVVMISIWGIIAMIRQSVFGF